MFLIHQKKKVEKKKLQVKRATPTNLQMGGIVKTRTVTMTATKGLSNKSLKRLGMGLSMHRREGKELKVNVTMKEKC
jgi:hypothetical protein